MKKQYELRMIRSGITAWENAKPCLPDFILRSREPETMRGIAAFAERMFKAGITFGKRNAKK